MKRVFWILLLGMGVLMLNGLDITDSQGFTRSFDLAIARALPREEVTTISEKTEAEVKWQGFRLKPWLDAQGYTEFDQIRIQAPDRYQVLLSAQDFVTGDAWMIFSRDGKELDDAGIRIIFTKLREMNWIRNPERISLEKSSFMGRPSQFMFLDRVLKKLTLTSDPAPFKKISGYFFIDVAESCFEDGESEFLFYTKDGLRSKLEYPLHLEGAVLELKDDGSLSLKSPKIPGGMWLNQIVYIQANDKALIRDEALGMLIDIAVQLNWKSEPDLKATVCFESEKREMDLSELMTSEKLSNRATGFELR
ncbi:MAG: hypothetical protein PHI68_00455 [Candidatus Cloacimonetes bacterium]|nr:hypothetical protein [Candidatus Cloacimonadota bacterium]